MSYRLPPLNGLRAFEAAGRHLSFLRAAEELAVTPGAVSQQVKNLEQAIGVPLFQRLHRSLILTSHGEALLPSVSDAFRLLSAASDGVARGLKTRPLKLGVSPRLAEDPKQLLALLGKGKRLTELVRIMPTDDLADLMGGSLDALLRPGAGPYPGMHAERLTLSAAFAPHRQAALIVWPGLSTCREFLKVKALLTEP
jgi:LysR family glycine cleavage system transcriptional activator